MISELAFRAWRRGPVILLGFLVTAAFSSTATPDDLSSSEWRPVGGQPEFSGRPGHWDALIRERGWILAENGRYRMWYTGYNPEDQPVTMKLGYAESEDGLHWNRRDRPLYEKHWVEDMTVVRDGDRYLMFAEGRGDQAHWLTSSDGFTWQREGVIDIRLRNGQPIPPGPFGTPVIFRHDELWYLFYERRDQGIWLATSADLKTFRHVSDDPVITLGQSVNDGLMLAMNQVVEYDGHFFAVLHGTSSPQKPRQWSTTLWQSPDLLQWAPCGNNPLRPVAENKSSGLLIRNPDGGSFRLYTMHASVVVHEQVK